jgi:diguanylate cyclase (GGDEF)-like protein/PAS domain S-box-containing protein
LKIISKTLSWLLGALLVLAAAIAFMFWSYQRISEASSQRQHTREVINSASGLLSDLIDAETGERGYVLTGNDAYLQPYLAVRDTINSKLKELQELNGNTSDSGHLDTMKPLIDAKMAELATIIELRRSGNLTAARQLIDSGTGKRQMDGIRAEMDAFLISQARTQSRNDAVFDASMRRLLFVMTLFAALAVLSALVFTYLFYQRSQQRARNLVHLETRHLLEVQEQTNQRLAQANQQLEDSQQKLAVTLNSIGDAVIATDAAACVTLLNPVAEALTGWTQAQALGQPIDEVFHIVNKDTRMLAMIPVADALAHGTVQGLANHTVLIARDAREFDISDSCAPIRDAAGSVVGAVLVFRNVSDEYAVQQTLRDSAALVQTILNTVADGLVTVHADGGTIETTNPAIELLFGYSAAELAGKPLSVLIPELDQDQRNVSLEYYEASDANRAVGIGREVMGKRKDGSAFPLEISASEMMLRGQRYFTGILRDNTARKQAEEALLKAGALQKAIFDSANFSSIATDAKGVIQIFNVGAERMLGYTAAEVMNQRTPADISDPQEIVARAKTLSAEFETNITPGFEALVFKASRGIEDIYELTYIRKDGSRFPAVVSITALRDAQNTIIGYLLIGTDNTARKQIEVDQKVLGQRLRDHQFYTRSLFEANIDALMTTDPSGVITDVNKQMELLTGCTRDELIGAPFKNSFTDPVRAEDAIMLALTKRKVTNYELTARDRDGKETVVSFNATTFYDRDRRLQGVFAAARDITERKLAEKQILELALHDPLTGLPNRLLLTERLGLIMAASKRHKRYSALMFLDLDNFKPINDTHGHFVGDLLLMEVARRISSCVRAVDIVSRFGGDEFVVILSELSLDKTESTAQSKILAEKLRLLLDRPYVLTYRQEGKNEITVEHRCTTSIGVVLFNDHEGSQDEILKWADAAMYEAKEAGGNQIRYYDTPTH